MACHQHTSKSKINNRQYSATFPKTLIAFVLHQVKVPTDDITIRPKFTRSLSSSDRTVIPLETIHELSHPRQHHHQSDERIQYTLPEEDVTSELRSLFDTGSGKPATADRRQIFCDQIIGLGVDDLFSPGRACVPKALGGVMLDGTIPRVASVAKKYMPPSDHVSLLKEQKSRSSISNNSVYFVTPRFGLSTLISREDRLFLQLLPNSNSAPLTTSFHYALSEPDTILEENQLVDNTRVDIANRLSYRPEEFGIFYLFASLSNQKQELLSYPTFTLVGCAVKCGANFSQAYAIKIQQLLSVVTIVVCQFDGLAAILVYGDDDSDLGCVADDDDAPFCLYTDRPGALDREPYFSVRGGRLYASTVHEPARLLSMNVSFPIEYSAVGETGVSVPSKADFVQSYSVDVTVPVTKVFPKSDVSSEEVYNSENGTAGSNGSGPACDLSGLDGSDECDDSRQCGLNDAVYLNLRDEGKSIVQEPAGQDSFILSFYEPVQGDSTAESLPFYQLPHFEVDHNNLKLIRLIQSDLAFETLLVPDIPRRRA